MNHKAINRLCAAILFALLCALLGCSPATPTLTVAPSIAPSPAPTNTVIPTSTISAAARKNGKIAFVSTRDGNQEIYVMNEDGTGQINVTKNPANDYSPKWSPDGRQIAFLSNRDDKNKLYLVELTGLNITKIDTNSIDEFIWSPDGKQIATLAEDGSINIITLNDFSTTQITKAGWRRAISWSHNGKWITYSCELGLCINKVSDATETRLENGFISPAELSPTWSPDGEKIAFLSCLQTVKPEGGYMTDLKFDLYIINLENSRTTALTKLQDILVQHDILFDKYVPLFNWSSDNNKIIFASPNYQAIFKNSVDESDLYTINTDGSGQKRLTNTNSGNCCAVWSSDNKKIIFVSKRDGNNEIYIMNADGSNQINLTNNPADDSSPDWQPLP